MSEFKYRDLITLIKSYDGSKENLEYFVSDCERCFKSCKGKVAELVLNYIKSELNALRMKFVNVLDINSWSELKKWLYEYFGIPQDANKLLNELTKMQNNSNSIFNFYIECLSKFNEYSMALREQYCNDAVTVGHLICGASKRLLDTFTSGLDDHLKYPVRAQNFKTIEEAYEFVKELSKFDTDQSVRGVDPIKNVKMIKNSVEFESKFVEIQAVCQMIENVKNSDEVNPNINPNNDVVTTQRQCQICKRFGHISSSCRLRFQNFNVKGCSSFGNVRYNQRVNQNFKPYQSNNFTSNQNNFCNDPQMFNGNNSNHNSYEMNNQNQNDGLWKFKFKSRYGQNGSIFNNSQF